MTIKESLKQKREVLDNILKTIDKLLKEIKEEKKVKDINELIFCLMLLKQISIKQKHKLGTRPIGTIYS